MTNSAFRSCIPGFLRDSIPSFLSLSPRLFVGSEDCQTKHMSLLNITGDLVAVADGLEPLHPPSRRKAPSRRRLPTHSAARSAKTNRPTAVVQSHWRMCDFTCRPKSCGLPPPWTTNSSTPPAVYGSSTASNPPPAPPAGSAFPTWNRRRRNRPVPSSHVPGVPGRHT